MGAYVFEQQIAFSRGIRERTDIQTLRNIIPKCKFVKKASLAEDKNGIDYIATLTGGAEVYIDAKARDKGCSRYWRGFKPELALEIWSVMPGGKFNTPKERSIPGWTLSDSKLTDLVLFTFHPSDTRECFLVGFQPLRMAFIQNHSIWANKYKNDIQESRSQSGGRWQSKCVFVPIDEVLNAIWHNSCQQIYFQSNN